MRPYPADPPTSFADRLQQLNENLQAMAGRLKDAIAGAVSTAIGQAIRDVIRRMLGDEKRQDAGRFDRRFERDPYADRFESDNDRWRDDSGDDSWYADRQESASTSYPASSRWGDAFRTTVQTALWWLRTQPCRRPVLTTALVALTAGGAAFFAGPTLAACVSIIASIASLLLTADSARTAGEMAS